MAMIEADSIFVDPDDDTFRGGGGAGGGGGGGGGDTSALGGLANAYKVGLYPGFQACVAFGFLHKPLF
jgi:hypothetical protein